MLRTLSFLAATALLSVACSTRVTSTGAAQSRGTPAGATTLGADNCNSRNRDATLAGRVVLSFTGAPRGEATVRIEGETYKSTVKVDVATGTTLELREDEYRVRITVPEYRAFEQTIKVMCGKEQTLSVPLRGR